MSRAIKLKNDDYIDSTSIVHNRKTITNILNNSIFSDEEIEIGVWQGRKAYRKIFVRPYYNKNTNTINTGLTNVSIFDIYGTFIGKNYTIPLNFHNGSVCFCHTNSDGSLITYGNGFEVGTIHVILEYLKN